MVQRKYKMKFVMGKFLVSLLAWIYENEVIEVSSKT